MATSDELRANPHAHWGLGLAVDGIQEFFVSEPDLEVVNTGDGRIPRRGLVREGLSRRLGVDSRNGHLTPYKHQIDIEDYVGDLAALFATDDASVEPLDRNIEPSDNLAAETDLHDKWIGHEKIGAAGERHQYPAPLGFTIGLQHHTLAEDADDSENPMSPPPVSDVPVLWKGRRVVLYRIFRDHIGDSALDAGLVAEFDLDTLENGPPGTTGTADGTENRGGPWSRRDFDGLTDRVDWANVQQLSNVASSGAGWAWFDEVASTLRIVFNTSTAANSFTVIFRRDTTRLDFAIVYTGGGSVNLRRLSNTGQVVAGQWHHVAWTYDGSGTAANVSLFVDGNEVSGYTTTTDGVGTPQVDDGPWSLGGRVNVDTNNHQGRIGGKFRVWARELTAAQVLLHYQTSFGWRPFAEWDPIWWGALEDDGTVEARVWSMRCAGVDVWLQRDLAALYQTKETPVDFEVSYIKDNVDPDPDKIPHEAGIAIRIYTSNEGTNGGQGGGGAGFYGDVQFNRSFSFTTDTVAELRDELVAAIGNAFDSAAGSTGRAWSATIGCFLGMSAADKTITFTVGEDVAERAVLILCMHQRMWGHLGFDLGSPGPGPLMNTHDPSGFYLWEAGGAHIEPPGDGYVYYRMVLQANDIAADTGDKPPLTGTLQPDYKGGVVSLDPNAVQDGQVMLVERSGLTSIQHYGQLRTPVASDPTDADAAWPLGGPAIDKSGLWLLSGKRRFADEEDELDWYQVVQASWGDSDGLVRSGRVVVTELLNPYNFGYRNKRLTTAWNAQPGAIVARPLVVLGARQGSSFDEAHIVMQRILLTTGTSTGWSSYSNNNPVLDAGDNESVHSGNVRRDAEYADLGLAIPAAFVQHSGRWHDEAEEVGEAIQCKVAITPGQNSEDILHGLMEPLGWAWSLDNGKYGVFCPYHPIEEEQITVAITRANVDRGTSRDMVIPSQELRQFAPIDRFKVSCSWAPHLEQYLFERNRKSRDRGVRYRPGGIDEQINAPWWRGQDGGFDTEPIFDRLQLKAKFWERRHFVIQRLPVLPTEGRQLWPGTFVRFSHPVPVDPMSGEYGISGRRGVVLGVEEQMGRERSKFLVDFLIHADRTATPKLHSISAEGYGYDSDNDRILVRDNWLALAGDGTRLDSAFFVEPAYVGLVAFGGSARIKWCQWDGSGWAFTGTGVVTAVGTTPGSCYIEMSAGIATGTYYPCKATIVMGAEIATQDAAWVLQLYTPVAAENGEYDTGLRSAVWEDVT